MALYIRIYNIRLLVHQCLSSILLLYVVKVGLIFNNFIWG